jgi:hypothetical protein
MRNLGVPWLGFLLVCVLSGCGLADYEKRIDANRTRLLIFDEENKYLGDMVEVPSQENKDGSRPIPFDIFMRLPRGIAGNIADKNGAYRIGDMVIYRYPGTEGSNVFLAAALGVTRDSPKKSKQAELLPEEFRDNFRRALSGILNEKFPPPEKIERLVRPPTNYAGEKMPDLNFDYFVLEDDPKRPNATYIGVYIHQKGARSLALGFQVPQANKSDMAVQQGIDLCLKSLDIGESALGKRTAYATSKRLD